MHRRPIITVRISSAPLQAVHNPEPRRRGCDDDRLASSGERVLASLAAQEDRQHNSADFKGPTPRRLQDKYAAAALRALRRPWLKSRGLQGNRASNNLPEACLTPLNRTGVQMITVPKQHPPPPQ